MQYSADCQEQELRQYRIKKGKLQRLEKGCLPPQTLTSRRGNYVSVCFLDCMCYTCEFPKQKGGISVYCGKITRSGGAVL